MPNKRRYKISYPTILIAISLILLFIVTYYETTDIQNIQHKIDFLQQEKTISARQFSILELDITNNNMENSINQINKMESIYDQENKQDNTTLNLNAILNNKALINERWFSHNETLLFSNDSFKLIKIQSDYITLKSNSSSKIIILNLQNDNKNDSFILE
ncbi:hypothetical protein LS73_001165 [Helicobacter muridarum]|uniref:Uncharacterized protein n=1 Tax=Helicobacter muridarum TaxID=216 RepID=A0A099TV61_9HELI|nr:hypothetical protein [Helicobacter muridarum]TLE01325.1 hypothetical protein LS73_001165 [Helicobacter muridarum]STQ87195.1 Uncharacterised protein [Helicobacter muridarum]